MDKMTKKICPTHTLVMRIIDRHVDGGDDDNHYEVQNHKPRKCVKHKVAIRIAVFRVHFVSDSTYRIQVFIRVEMWILQSCLLLLHLLSSMSY
jgi:hypothetical protein